jgi:chorismate-pyruvate lyase
VKRFRTKGYVPGGWLTDGEVEGLEMADLPAFLRTLLVTDGTVTRSIEAYFWETVNVEGLGQGVIAVDQAVESLELKQGEDVLRRRVRLVGEDSQAVYAHAESLLRLDRLPSELNRELQAGRIGIGELLRERSLETYRELLAFGVETMGPLTEVFPGKDTDLLVTRVYRIALNHQPTILITEKFPLALYKEANKRLCGAKLL